MQKTISRSTWPFWRERAPGNKNQNNFLKDLSSKYFSFNNFFENKNNIFQNNREKKFLGGKTIFEGTGCQTTKMNIIFTEGNKVPNTVFYVFSTKNSVPAEWKPKNRFWGHIFLSISGSTGLIDSKNNKVLHGQTCTNHVNFMKIGLKLRPVSCVLKYRICYRDLQNKKHNHPTSPLPKSMVSDYL